MVALDDNPALTAECKTVIRREYTGLWFRRFISGEWVAAEGAIFDMWDPDRHVVRYDELALPPSSARHRDCRSVPRRRPTNKALSR